MRLFVKTIFVTAPLVLCDTLANDKVYEFVYLYAPPVREGRDGRKHSAGGAHQAEALTTHPAIRPAFARRLAMCGDHSSCRLAARGQP